MKPNSLKQHLYNAIKNDTFGFVPLSELHAIAGDDHRRQSNAERRLRELVKAGEIERVTNKGIIIGYKMLNVIQKPKEELPLRPMGYREANNLL